MGRDRTAPARPWLCAGRARPCGLPAGQAPRARGAELLTTVRLFAGVPLGEAARRAIAAATRKVREGEWPVRWTAPDTWHLTVKFYGERDASQMEPILAGLDEAARGTPPLDLHFGALGTNGRGKRARVIWVEVDAPPAMELLHHRVEVAGERVGVELDGRPFRPHLTLGRVRDGRELPPEADGVLGATAADVSFLAEELVLYRSDLGPGGPRHTALRTWRLEAA